ncbi:unnamed protein product, partial [Ectocarpus sp. 13 AM-2016]
MGLGRGGRSGADQGDRSAFVERSGSSKEQQNRQHQQRGGVIPRHTYRRRRPDRMSKACTLLACGVGLQSWVCTDGFAGNAWRSSPSSNKAERSATHACVAVPPAETATARWQQRRPAARVSASRSSCRRVSGATIACSRTESASTVQVQENGGGDTQQVGDASWEDGEGAAADGIGAAVGAGVGASASSGTEEEDRSRRRKRKPVTANGGRNKLFDLLNDLEGGGGGGLEAIELLGVEKTTHGVGGSSGSMLLKGGPGQQHVVDHVALPPQHQMEEEEEEEEEEEAAERGLLPGPLKKSAGRKFSRRQGRMPPLTRSQSEEWRVLPMAERIQEIRHSKMKKKDPMKEEKCMEVTQILDKVKEEHGERGLGLTFIYSLGMRTCLDFGQPEKVVTLFSELKTFKESPPNRQAFEAASIAHSQLKQGDAAMEVILEMKESGWLPTERAYKTLLETIRGTEGASAVANRVIQLYVEDEDPEGGGAGLLPTSMDLCHQYLMVLAWANEWEQALEFFFKLVERGQPHPDQNCYNAVLHALNRSERWEETTRVMEAFRSHVRLMQHQQLEAPKPMRSLFLSALSTLLRVAKRTEGVEGYDEQESEAAMDEAIKVWKELKASGMYEGISPYSAGRLLHPLFNACDKHVKYWPTALEVFDIMESYEYSPDRSDDRWRDDEKAIGWRGGDGGISADERMAKEEDRTAPTAGEYRSMLHILSHSRDAERGANWERSMELLREAQESELPISESSFQTVMTDLGFAGEVDLAFSIYDDMRMAGIPPSLDTYNRLLGVCEKNKEWDRAFKILDEMSELAIKPDVVSFGAAISACGKGLEWRRALALLVRMQHDGIEPNLQCFNNVIHGLGLAGEWKRAEAMMEVIHKTGLVPDSYTYNSMAMAYASAGESDMALDVLDTMEKNGVQPDKVTYGTLMKACDGEGAFSVMRSLMDEMEQRGIPMTVHHYTTCIDAANRMEGTGMGWELWRQMGVKGVEPNNYAYSAIITTAAIDRDVRTALRLLEEMKTKGISIDVVSYTSAICACGPDWLLALDVLEEMDKDGVAPNLLSFTAAMGACFKGEEPREVINVFNRMKAAGVAPDLRAYNLAIMAHDADENHYGRASLEAELTEAGLSLQDKEWETAWVPPPDLGGGFSEIGEPGYDVGPPRRGGGGRWGDQGMGGGSYGQFEDYEGGG